MADGSRSVIVGAGGPAVYYARPVWAPALVGFVGGSHLSVSVGFGGPVVGWYPLAPWHRYRPHYPHNHTYVTVINQTIINNPPRGVPPHRNHEGATMVPGPRFRDPVMKVALPVRTNVAELQTVAPPPKNIAPVRKVADDRRHGPPAESGAAVAATIRARTDRRSSGSGAFDGAFAGAHSAVTDSCDAADRGRADSKSRCESTAGAARQRSGSACAAAEIQSRSADSDANGTAAAARRHRIWLVRSRAHVCRRRTCRRPSRIRAWRRGTGTLPAGRTADDQAAQAAGDASRGSGDAARRAAAARSGATGFARRGSASERASRA